jgi:hypothetical protein
VPPNRREDSVGARTSSIAGHAQSCSSHKREIRPPNRCCSGKPWVRAGRPRQRLGLTLFYISAILELWI